MLKFTSPQAFIQYLKEQNIHRYGLIPYERVSPNAEGLLFFHEFFRLSTIDDNEKELIRCDLIYYSGVLVTVEHGRKEAHKPKEEMLKKILKAVKEEIGDYEMKMLDCEFTEIKGTCLKKPLPH